MTPPNMAHMGDTYPAAVLAKVVRTPSGSTSSIFVAGGRGVVDLAWRDATTAAASRRCPGSGGLPFLAANGVQRLEAEVEDGAAVELGKVGEEKLARVAPWTRRGS
jgi:hypothetical protein